MFTFKKFREVLPLSVPYARKRNTLSSPVSAMVESLESRQLMTAVVAAAMPTTAITPATPVHSAVTGAHPAATTKSTAAAHVGSFTASGYADSTTEVTLNWSKSANATNYQVDMWSNGAWVSLGSVSSATTSVNVNNLNAGTTYYFSIGAYNSNSTLWSSTITVATKTAHTAPAAPTLTAAATSSSTASLNWTASTGATSYTIEEYVNNAWVNLGTVSSTQISATISNLSASTTYGYEVGATNAYGTTWSAYKSITTPAASVTVNEPAIAAGSSYTLVTGSLFGANGPQFTDVHQGQVGDCWLLSSLAATAARYPSDITSMFTAAGTAVENGTTVNLWKVRFYNASGVAEYVTVDNLLPKTSSYFEYDSPTNGVLWVALAEKAYAEANGMGYVTTSNLNQDSYAALNSGSPTWALQAITGKAASGYAVNPTNLAAAWNAGDIICIDSSYKANDNLIVGDSSGTHAYAVVGYNAGSSTPFEVYNPWGASSAVNGTVSYNGHQVYGGTFWASTSLIAADYAEMDFGAKMKYDWN